MTKPDYVKCVNLEGGTWCGAKRDPLSFVSIDHAAINGKNEGRLIVCGDCRHEIIKALSNGCTYV